MWIFAKDGFVSIVQDEWRPRSLTVRARVKGDIERLMGCKAVFEDTTGEHDYRFRSYIDRHRVADRIAEAVCAIRYPVFKQAVTDKRRSGAYFDVWNTLAEMQDDLMGVS